MKKFPKGSLVNKDEDYYNRDMEMSRNTIEEDVEINNFRQKKRLKKKKK